uniref:C3H1-type domain-containing protein n=1 Tax=Panagrellus redivivus TaxID=6233 RepID=A0A7E4UPG6_PANRE
MESIKVLPRPIGSPPVHKPLQRVLPSKVATPSADELASAHPLLFTSSSTSTVTPLRQGAVSPKPAAHPTASDASNPDSCYSSCSEESHASLSRESSDSADKAKRSDSPDSLKGNTGDIDEALLRDFANKLGFSDANLRIVLEKLGPEAQQNNVLAELILLGKNAGSHQKTAVPPPKAASPGAGGATEVAKPKLRPIVIDGSNIAMTHGHKEVFSCLGIRECVNFFVNRGHEDIIVFVPKFHREAPRFHCPITDQHILYDLEAEQRLIWTPARNVNGRRIVCHDDKYILKTAEEKEAIIVSNDEYRDLVKEVPQYRSMVEQRLLMYSFVGGKFMPPDDPLGRRGPTLSQFLSMTPTMTAQPCPYAKKCTYGNKCKYYHPERKNGVRQSVTERLTNGGKSKQTLRERPSMAYEMNSVRGGTRPNALQSPALSNLQNRNAVGRTQSLNLPPGNVNGNPYGFTPQPNGTQMPYWNPQHNHPPPQIPPQHLALNRNFSTPLRSNASTHYEPLLPQGLLNHIDADSGPNSRSSSLSDFLFPQQNQPTLYGSESHMYSPSTAIWGESLYSVGPFVNTRDTTPTPPQHPIDDNRSRLEYHLCQLFPKATVMAVMAALPNETDPQKLCQRIIALQQGFEKAT